MNGRGCRRRGRTVYGHTPQSGIPGRLGHGSPEHPATGTVYRREAGTGKARLQLSTARRGRYAAGADGVGPANDAARRVISYPQPRAFAIPPACRSIIDIDVPDVHIPVTAVVNNPGVASIDVRRPVQQPVRDTIRAGVHAETDAAHGVVQVAIDHGPVIRTQGGPDEIVAVAHRRYPSRPPRRTIRPQPAITAVVRPASIVRGHVGKRVVVNPAVPVRRHIAPIPMAVGYVIHDRGGTPVIAAVDIDPIAMGSQRCSTDHRGLNDFGGDCVIALGERFGPFPAPGVEIVFHVPVENDRSGRKVSGIDKHTFTR